VAPKNKKPIKKQVDDLIKHLETLPAKISADAVSGTDFVKLSQVALDQGRSPAKEKWAKRKKDVPWRILNKTGNLKNSYSQQHIKNKNVTRLKNTATYSAAQHSKRQILPVSKIPKDWLRLIQKQAAKIIKKEFN